jgi:hypothetical protein
MSQLAVDKLRRLMAPGRTEKKSCLEVPFREGSNWTILTTFVNAAM